MISDGTAVQERAMETESLPPVLPFASASDELLSAILDQSPDCVKVLSAEGRLEYMNRNGQCALEIDDFAALAGREWTEMWPEETRAVIRAAVEQARESGSAELSAFCPTAKGTPKWWDVSVKRLNVGDSFAGFVAVSRDITERVSAQETSDAIAAEMRHRLRNAYHVVGSLMSAFARGAPEREGFARDMLARLSALGAAQTLQSEKANLDLGAVVPALVSPYATPECPIRIGGLPKARLEQRQMDALAMVLGELAVNSTKHGALSARGEVTIEAVDDQALVIRWSERSDRRVQARHRAGGNGMVLMKRVLAACGGDIEVEWLDNGLDVSVTLEPARA